LHALSGGLWLKVPQGQNIGKGGLEPFAPHKVGDYAGTLSLVTDNACSTGCQFGT